MGDTMKEKLLQFFTGKMSKSIYISIASAVVCGAVVITSTVIVHNNNQKIDSVLESLSESESVSELSSESASESVSASDEETIQSQAQTPNNEPAGDKALQYLAEYDKLTAEYQAKRAELTAKTITHVESPRPQKPLLNAGLNDSSEDISRKQAELNSEYERILANWEESSSVLALEREQAELASSQLEQLKIQYEKDVSALKARYGIA